MIQEAVIANDTSHLSSSDHTLGHGDGVKPPQMFTSDLPTATWQASPPFREVQHKCTKLHLEPRL